MDTRLARERLQDELTLVRGGDAVLDWRNERVAGLESMWRHPADHLPAIPSSPTELSPRVAAIHQAIVRLEAGTYGTCARCAGAIGDERLEAKPDAVYCLRCQRAVERARNGGAAWRHRGAESRTV